MMASRLKWVISLVVALCVMVPTGLAFAQAAGLSAVGAPDPANGFPKWYIDKNGLQLAPCLDNNAADPCGLIAAGALPNPALPVVFPTNFPNEVFYNRATARIDGIGGGAFRADLGIALEGAFGGATGTVADGIAAEVVFARLRIRVNGGLVPGASYTATYPFGSQTFVATAVGTINFTNNQGCLAAPPACDFNLAVANTNIGPFLQWDPAASVPPAGYIGNPAIPHAIIGSANNTFSISGPNVGGPGVNTVSTNLFNVTGKIFVRASTTTTLTAAPNPSTVGQAVTLTATVRPVAPATGVPTGSVSFRDGATTIETATLDATGTASIVVSTLGAGNHSLTAVYAGSPDFQTSTSAVVTQVVRAATTTTLSSTPNPSTAGQGVTLTATVLPVAPATGVPTGSVSFRDGTTTIGSATLGATGTASIVVSTLTAGSHSLTAAYAGAGNFLASTSAVVTQVVNAPPAPGTDTVTITRAQLILKTGELRVDGVNTPIGLATSVEIHSDGAVGTSCPGPLIATTPVRGSNAHWSFRDVISFSPATICVKSDGGGVATSAVTPK